MPIRSDQIKQNLWKATGILTLSKHTQTLNKIPNHTATTEMQPNKLRSIEICLVAFQLLQCGLVFAYV